MDKIDIVTAYTADRVKSVELHDMKRIYDVSSINVDKINTASVHNVSKTNVGKRYISKFVPTCKT